MDNFKIIYKILKAFEKSLDCEEIDIKEISSEALNISEQRWSRIIKMIVDNGYVEGIRIVSYDGARIPLIKFYNPTITLAGLEYLEENSLMKKAANIAKGISDMIP